MTIFYEDVIDAEIRALENENFDLGETFCVEKVSIPSSMLLSVHPSFISWISVFLDQYNYCRDIDLSFFRCSLLVVHG